MKKKPLYTIALLFFLAGGAFAQTNTTTEQERAERKARLKSDLKEAGQAIGGAATEVGQGAKETAKKAGAAIDRGADKAAVAIQNEADKIKARQRERKAANEARRDTL